MDWLSEFVPATPSLVLSLFLLAFVLLLALTRLRGTWFAALAGSSMAIIFLVMSSVGQTDALSWRFQVIIQRFVELPVVCGVAVMCIVQVRRLTPSDNRFQIVLRVAPALLISAWVVSFALQQVWPHPILDYFEDADRELVSAYFAVLSASILPRFTGISFLSRCRNTLSDAPTEDAELPTCRFDWRLWSLLYEHTA
jgi:hypothetical protein